MVRFLLTNSCFAGPENWYRTKAYFLLIFELLAAPTLVVDKELLPPPLIGLGDVSVKVLPADKTLDAREGKLLPNHVLRVAFFGQRWRIRLRRRPADDAAPEASLEEAPEAPDEQTVLGGGEALALRAAL
jgi:hypothetical protein